MSPLLFRPPAGPPGEPRDTRLTRGAGEVGVVFGGTSADSGVSWLGRRGLAPFLVLQNKEGCFAVVVVLEGNRERES